MEKKEYEIISKLKIIGKIMRSNVKDQFKELDITSTQGMMIGILSHQGNLKISDLSKQMGLSNATVSGIVDRLENKDIVKRIRSTEDRRVVNVCLNEIFKNNFNHIFMQTDKIKTIASENELDTILKGLILLEDVLNRTGDENA